MSVMNRKTVRRNSSGLTGRLGSSRDLAETPKAGKAVLCLEDFNIVADEYEYPIEDRVPHGYYYSKIMKIEPRWKADRAMLDVCYDIRPTQGSNVYCIKQTYPAGSKPLTDFYKALIAAGVEPGPNLKDAIGIEELIAVGYVSNTSDFGSITKRWPKAVAESRFGVSADDDDEFEDFLSEIDDE